MCEQVEAGAAADVEHRGAAAVDHPDEAGLLQTLEGLADGVPVDGEGDGELALGRQRVAGCEPSGEHGVAQLGEDLVGHGPAGDATEPALVSTFAHDVEDDTGASTHQEVGPVLSAGLLVA